MQAGATGRSSTWPVRPVARRRLGLVANLDREPFDAAEAARLDGPALPPPGARFDPLAQAARLHEIANDVPKTLKWKTRARVGDRVKWYELPEEVAH